VTTSGHAVDLYCLCRGISEPLHTGTVFKKRAGRGALLRCYLSYTRQLVLNCNYRIQSAFVIFTIDFRVRVEIHVRAINIVTSAVGSFCCLANEVSIHCCVTSRQLVFQVTWQRNISWETSLFVIVYSFVITLFEFKY
jgi:hypothetical protein